MVPFTLFTLASSRKSNVSFLSTIDNTSKSALLGFLCLYTFTISNQINGVEEDRINKPDRPIVSGRLSLESAITRYIVLLILCANYTLTLDAGFGAFVFMAAGALHNFSGLTNIGPFKDALATVILTSGLNSAWALGGGDSNIGTAWIICLAINLLFTISVQDLRDVAGDARTGRRTTPLLLGEPYGRRCPSNSPEIHIPDTY